MKYEILNDALDAPERTSNRSLRVIRSSFEADLKNLIGHSCAYGKSDNGTICPKKSIQNQERNRWPL